MRLEAATLALEPRSVGEGIDLAVLFIADMRPNSCRARFSS